MTVFKTIFAAAKLEEAALNTLSIWMPTYIKEVERQTGMTPGLLTPPQLYTNRNSFDVLPGEKWPILVAISPGLAESPRAKGDGQYVADWRLGIGVAVPGLTEIEANLKVKVYAAAIRAIMVHKQSLGGIANVVTWVDETYDDLPMSNQNMVYKSASEFFAVEIQDVVTKWAGPEFPDQDPYVYGRVEHVIIDIEEEPVDVEF